MLEPGGLIAFTVETHAGEGILLRDTLRYAHAEAYVREALAAAGLALVSCAAESTRKEKEQPVPGLVVVAIAGGLSPPSILRGSPSARTSG